MEEEEDDEDEDEEDEEKPAADTVKTAADVNAASRQNLDAESEEGMEEEELEEEDSVVDVTMDEEEAPVKQRATPVYAATTPPVPRAYAARAKVAAEVRRLDKVNVDQATANARHVKATMRKVAPVGSSTACRAASARRAASASRAC